MVTTSCGGGFPQTTFNAATQALRRGHAVESQRQAAEGYRKYRSSNPTWASKFLVLEAQAALERGLNDEVLSLLAAPLPSDPPDLAISGFMLVGIAHVNKHNLPEAERYLTQAMKLCEHSELEVCGYVLQGRGLLASEQSDSDAANRLYNLSLQFARSHSDAFLESNALLNLGAESLSQGHYDEAIQKSESAYKVAKTVDAGILQLDAEGNIGWAYYKLGDAERALARFLAAEKRAGELADVADQGVWLTNAGYVYMDSRNFPLALQSLQRALTAERQVDKKEHIYNALRALARLALQTGDIEQSSHYADEALVLARQSDNRVDELYPLLVQGQIAAAVGNVTEAEKIFHEVELDQLCPVYLKWDAQHSLANLYENKKKLVTAEREYRLALATFEGARADVRHEDLHLSFFTNGWRIYDDYVHFLVSSGKTNEALRWADYSRDRTLSEGLGELTEGAASGAPVVNAVEIARQRRGTVLYYWLGEKQSYLWAITPQKTALFSLPPGAEIDAAVQRYRASLGGPQDVLSYGDNDGRWLYRTMVAPAQSLLPKGGTVFVVPDGSLNNLNFETLLVEVNSSQFPVLGSQSNASLASSNDAHDPTARNNFKLHYWIEDATLASASSLRALSASPAAEGKPTRRLLLVGDSIPPSDKFPALARAKAQMDAVAAHFPENDREVISRQAATPASYFNSHPEQFTHLHFVAHGTASRLSPLDSAIILSRGGSDDESFKLYARKIIAHPISADLVTISSCYGTGERAFKGEGLVGLSWAFLRAGAHNVVAALWDVQDTSVEKLMARFYDELDRGTSPMAALRTAKLSLLHSESLSSPYYWAPFQLYTHGATKVGGGGHKGSKAVTTSAKNLEH